MSNPDIKQPQIEFRNIQELKKWEDNPRTVLGEDFQRLIEQIKTLGLYRPLLINQDNIILGGNTTYEALIELGVEGDVAVSVVDAQTPERMLEYALSANDQVGVTDDLKLAELVHLHPINIELFKVQSNVLRPLSNIVNPPDPATLGGDPEADKSKLDHSMDTYMNGNIKQIVLYYGNEEYTEVVGMLEKIGAEFGLEDNTAIVTKLIRDYHAGIVTEP